MILRWVAIVLLLLISLLGIGLWLLTKDFSWLPIYLACALPFLLGMAAGWYLYFITGYRGLVNERILRPTQAGMAIVLNAEKRKILMNRQKGEPYPGLFILLGGYHKENETLAETARRRFYEITGVAEKDLEMLPENPPIAILNPNSFYVREFFARRSYSFSLPHAFILERRDRQPLDEQYIPGNNPDIQWVSFDNLDKFDIQTYYKELVEFILQFHHGDNVDPSNLRFWKLTDQGRKYFRIDNP